MTDDSPLLEEVRDHAKATASRFDPIGVVRSRMAGSTETSGLATLSADAGWLGIEAPAAVGGSDQGFDLVAGVAEAMGSVLAPFNFAVEAGICVPALVRSQAPFAEVALRNIVDGRTRVGVLLTDGPGDTLAATPCDGGFTITGRCGFVVQESTPDVYLIAVDGGGAPLVALVEPTRSDHFVVESSELFDHSRRFVQVNLAEMFVPTRALLAEGPTALATISLVRERFALLVAADSLGIARAALGLSVEFAKLRRQFDRPIGSFQALKHRFADMYALVECSAVLVNDAASEVGALAVADEARALTVSLTKSFVCDAASKVAAEAMQMHGGIGYTWEADIHLYVKRAKLNQALGGDTRAHALRAGRILTDFVVPARDRKETP